MTEHLQLIIQKIDHLQRMQKYLAYSAKRAKKILPANDWNKLTQSQHEILAAFRVRFSEFQEHIGKTMRAVANEEEIETSSFSSVLAFMEKICVIDSTERWKTIREIRNSVNHEYEDDVEVLNQFFAEMVKATPELFNYYQQLQIFCMKTYLAQARN